MLFVLFVYSTATDLSFCWNESVADLDGSVFIIIVNSDCGWCQVRV